MRWWPRGWWPYRTNIEAEWAVIEADQKLAEAHSRDPEIKAVTDRLNVIRRRNQFGPMIEEAFRRQRP